VACLNPGKRDVNLANGAKMGQKARKRAQMGHRCVETGGEQAGGALGRWPPKFRISEVRRRSKGLAALGGYATVARCTRCARACAIHAQFVVGDNGSYLATAASHFASFDPVLSLLLSARKVPQISAQTP